MRNETCATYSSRPPCSDTCSFMAHMNSGSQPAGTAAGMIQVGSTFGCLGWRGLARPVAGYAGSQVPHVVIQVGVRAQECCQLAQQTAELGQQVPPQRVQLEVLHEQQTVHLAATAGLDSARFGQKRHCC